jgi:hypothetical protein
MVNIPLATLWQHIMLSGNSHDKSKTEGDKMPKYKDFSMVRSDAMSAVVRLRRAGQECLYRLVKRLSGEM